jgi:hypothetical protein
VGVTIKLKRRRVEHVVIPILQLRREQPINAVPRARRYGIKLKAKTTKLNINTKEQRRTTKRITTKRLGRKNVPLLANHLTRVRAQISQGHQRQALVNGGRAIQTNQAQRGIKKRPSQIT